MLDARPAREAVFLDWDVRVDVVTSSLGWSVPPGRADQLDYRDRTALAHVGTSACPSEGG
jgi:hypothetical protein